MPIRRFIISVILLVLLLFGVSLIISLWIPLIQAMKITFGTFTVIVLPGISWTWVFYEKREIDFIERIIISIALSIAFIPLLLYILKKLKMEMSLFTILIAIGISFISGIAVLFIKKLQKNGH
ncbi:MAG: hypothetical protein PHY34_01305 [Patescibacteria group bacterium]|nr:hypothetical protein [Patescibacteria group bacterium]MDD5715143.1 hypothetical protein [Patescibacteria group bacterium]